MNQEELQKSIQILEKATHIALVLPREINIDLMAAGEVFIETLTKKGKRVGFLLPPVITSALHPEAYASLQSPALLLKEFIISVNTANTPASELRYDRPDGRIDIVLSPKTYPFSPEMVSFRDGKMLCECVVAIGIADLGDFDSGAEIDPAFFTDTPSINFDISPKNTRFGDVNFVTPEKTSFSELIYDFLIEFYKEPLTESNATLLLSGIIEETEGFKSPKTNADTLLAASELTRLGARHHDAFALSRPKTPLGLIQLFGRASVRSKLDEAHTIVWSFLTPEDFEKTGRTPDDCPLIVARLKNEFAGEKLCVLLWQGQEEAAVSVLVAAAPPLLEKIQSLSGGELSHHTLKIETPYISFRETEEYTSELLKKTL